MALSVSRKSLVVNAGYKSNTPVRLVKAGTPNDKLGLPKSGRSQFKNLPQKESSSSGTSLSVLAKLEKLKVLSQVEKLGVLSKLEKSGLTLSKIEKLGLLSTAEKFGLLSVVADDTTPLLLNLTALALLAGAGITFGVSSDPAVGAVGAVVLGAAGVAALTGASLLDKVQKL